MVMTLSAAELSPRAHVSHGSYQEHSETALELLSATSYLYLIRRWHLQLHFNWINSYPDFLDNYLNIKITLKTLYKKDTIILLSVYSISFKCLSPESTYVDLVEDIPLPSIIDMFMESTFWQQFYSSLQNFNFLSPAPLPWVLRYITLLCIIINSILAAKPREFLEAQLFQNWSELYQFRF